MYNYDIFRVRRLHLTHQGEVIIFCNLKINKNKFRGRH